MSDSRSHPLDECKDEPKACLAGSSFSGWQVWVAVGLIVGAGLLAYHNSYNGPFIFDDIRAIPGNPSIAKLWPIWQALAPPPPGRAVQRRPIVNLSLAVNYALGGLRVRGYHEFNLIMHIVSGLILFGVLRRTLLSERLRDRFGRASWPLALVCSLIWLVHPLQTNAVTYIIQRTELLAGLFYLLTLYCVIRGAGCHSAKNESSESLRWYAAAVFSCLLGMGSKEIVVSAPLVILLYDRLFLSGSFREVLRRRWGLYVGLAATWGLLVILHPYGAGGQPLGAFEYAARQFEAITTYLRLCFWPAPLILDYGQGTTPSFLQALPYAVFIIVLLAGTVLAIRYRPAIGFLGVWFFAILAPSSSFVPLNEWAAEKRMYLPLAAVVVMVVLCGYIFGKRFLHRLRISEQGGSVSGVVGYSLAVVVILVLGWLSVQRNYDYRNKFSIWNDTVVKCRGNWRAHYNRGNAYYSKGEDDRAISDFDEAIRLRPRFAIAYNNRGVVYRKQGKYELAISDFDRAIKLNPKYAKAYLNRGLAYSNKGDYELVIPDLDKAIQLNPSNAKACNNLAWILATHENAKLRDGVKAVHLAEQACELEDYKAASTLDTLAAAYAETKQFDQAVKTARRALQLARNAGEEELARKIQNHLESYRAKRAWRESFGSKALGTLESKR